MAGRSEEIQLQCHSPLSIFIPEGCLRVAQRFNAGTNVRTRQVPKRRLSHSFQPSRLDLPRTARQPSVETPLIDYYIHDEQALPEIS